MKFNSQICTSAEQSKRLLDLGLKPETADMELIYNIFSNTYEPLPKSFPTANKCEIPAWSMHRLLEMYVERYISCNVNLKELTFDWLINEIEIHITENDFNKEYLKQ